MQWRYHHGDSWQFPRNASAAAGGHERTPKAWPTRSRTVSPEYWRHSTHPSSSPAIAAGESGPGSVNPLSTIFGAGVAVRNALYDQGVFKVRKLARPVVSVGNISVGGSGKTPFVIALGELLKQRGITFDVLSRAYGRTGTEVAIVDANGPPEHFGDEPLLIARKLQVPFIVAADRHEAGRMAESKITSQLHLLGDGFRNRRLHRDFDVVVLPDSDGENSLLPGGRLREPVSALRRGAELVLRVPPSFQKSVIWRAVARE